MRAAETILIAATDEGAVLEAATLLLGDYFDYGVRYLLRYDQTAGILRVTNAAGPGTEDPSVREFRTTLGRGLTGICAQTQQVLNVGDVRLDARYIMAVPSCVSEICVPIHVRDELLGVLAIESETANAFSPDDEATLTAFAQLLALGLMHARAHGAHRRDLDELRAVADVAREASTLDLDRTLQIAVERFRALTLSDSTAVYLLDVGGRELVPARVSFDPALYPPDYVERIGHVPWGVGFVGWVAEHREPILSPDVSQDPRVRALPGISLDQKSAICVPLLVEAQLHGVIRATRMGLARYTPDHLRLAETIASQTALAIAAAQAHKEARRLAVTDELTDLFNARYLTDRLKQEVDRALRHARPLALLIVDSDSLKAVNDEYGHACGDRLLIDLAATMRSQIRSTDIAGRYGGDEFLVIAPETTGAAMLTTAERLLQAVEDRPLITDSGIHIRLTVSIGIADLGGQVTTSSELFQAADRALYLAKRRGKNQVALSVDS